VYSVMTQLRATALDPRRAFLAQLFDEQVDTPTALARLAAFHIDSGRPMESFRREFVEQKGHAFPHPMDVPLLLSVLFVRARQTFATCKTVNDDLHVAALAAYAVAAIHPYDDGNGRVAIDLAQHLLMVRWQTRVAPLAMPADAHRVLGTLFAPFDEGNSGDSVADFLAVRETVGQRIGGADLDTLRDSCPFSVAALWFEKTLFADLEPRGRC
jgi:hypothetical protein